MNRLITILALAVAAMGAWASAPLCGTWHGALNVYGSELPLVLHIDSVAPGQYSATLDSPMQGAKGIPARAKIDGATITATIETLGAEYVGTLVDGDAIEGTFTQMGQKFDLRMTPGDYVPPRPQTPREPLLYPTRQVEFVNPADSAVLRGTLTLPLQYSIPAFSGFPVVLMVTGSGLQNRDEEILGHKPFAVIADYLAKNGIASLRYDDRGYGESTGDYAQATTATFAQDAAAGLEYLRHAHPRLGRVGVLGHSEGGTIAYMLAAQGLADFVVSLAGPAVDGATTLKDQNRRMLAASGMGAVADDYAQALDLLYAYMRANPEAKEWPECDQATACLTHLTPQLRENLQSVIAARNPWIDYFLTYDPVPDLDKVRVPVLAVHGDLDMQVSADLNVKALREHVPDAQIITYRGLNHLLQPARTGLPTEYGAIETTVDPQVLTDIAAFIKSQK